VDIVCWNNQHPNGLYFLPSIISVGAIEWLEPVSGEHIKWFMNKLKEKGLSFGVLLAVNNLIDEQEARAEVRDIISSAFSDERQIVILRGKDLEKVSDSSQLVTLFKEKLCELAVV